MKRIAFIETVVVIIWISAYVAIVSAQTSPSLRLNELSINPEGLDNGKEWIELENYGNENVSTQDISLVVDNTYIHLSDFCSVISSNSFCVIEFSDLTLHNDFGKISLTYEEISFDNFEYATEIPDGKILALIEGAWILTDIPTKGSSNSSEEQEEPEIIFSEIYPSPVSPEKEWIEIYNEGSSDLALSEISFYRDSCSSEKISKDLSSYTVEAEDYLVLYEENFTKKLLNGGGTLAICFNDKTISELTYPSTSNAKAYAKNDNLFQITTIPTPGEANQFDEEEESPQEEADTDELEVLSIDEAKTKDLDSKVKVQGKVTYSNENDLEVLYIQDDSSGIWIDLGKEFSGSFSGGVEVVGIFTKEHGEQKIRAEKINEIPKDFQISEINIDTFSEEAIGSLISTEGTITSKFSKSFDLENGLRVSTKFFEGTFLKEDVVHITGILSYNSNRFILLPINIEKEELKDEIVKEETLVSNTSIPKQTYANFPSVSGISSNKINPNYKLPSTDIYEYRNGGVFRTGIFFPGFLWIFFLFGISISIFLLTLKNKERIKQKILKVIEEIKNFEIPENYFRKR